VVDVDHHVPQRFLKTGKNDGEIVDNDGHSAFVDMEEVVEVAEKSARRLDFSQ